MNQECQIWSATQNDLLREPLNGSLSEWERAKGPAKAPSIHSWMVFAWQTVKDPTRKKNKGERLQRYSSSAPEVFRDKGLPVNVVTRCLIMSPVTDPLLKPYSRQRNARSPDIRTSHIPKHMCAQSSRWCTDAIPEVKMHAVYELLGGWHAFYKLAIEADVS